MLASNRASVWTAVAALGVLAFAPLLLAGDPRAWPLVRNTLTLACGAAAIALPMGVVLAILLFRTDLPARRGFGLILLALLFVPLYLQAAGWDAGFGRQGWFSLSRGTMAAPILDGWRAAIWIHGLAAIPWVTLIVGLGLMLVEPELEEAALLEGTPSFVLWRVSVRRAIPFVAAAALWVLVSTGTEMTVTDLYRVRTFAEEIYLDVPFAGTIGALEPMQATATTNVVLVGCLTMAALLLTARLAPSEPLDSARPPRSFALRNWRWPAVGFLVATLLATIGVPLANLIYKAGVTVEQIGAERSRHWSPFSFLRVVLESPLLFREEFGWTVLIAGVTALSATVAAAPLAWLARRGGPRAIPAFVVTALSLAAPGPAIGLGVVWLLNREGSDVLIWLYDRSILAPCLALLVRCLPVVVLILWYGFQTISEDVVQQASSEGAGRMTRFWSIGVRQRWGVIAGASLAAFAIAAGDLAASILVIPPGIATIPARVFGLLHSGVDDQVAGICLVEVWAFVLVGGGALGMLGPKQTFGDAYPSEL